MLRIFSLLISCIISIECSATITIPEGTTVISESEFENCDQLVTLNLPNSLITISNRAFYSCMLLTGSLNIPNSVTEIGDYAFAYCSRLSSITLPTNLNTIGYGSFISCSSLEGIITIHSTIQEISSYAFYRCSKLGKIEFNSQLQNIGNYSFGSCSSLTGQLTLPDSLISLGDHSFYDCGKLTSLHLSNQLQIIGHHSFFYCASLGGALEIPDTVTEISDSSFQMCSQFTSLKLSANLQTLGTSCFEKCSGLAGTLTIPAKVTIISDNVFQGCVSLTLLQLHSGIESIGNQAFFGCSSFEGSLEIPSSVKDIGSFAFYQCVLLTSLQLSSSLEEIGSAAFRECSGFAGSLTIPQTVKTIGHSAFRDCIKFDSLTISSTKMTIIEKYTFFNCSGLSDTFSIPNKVTEIGDFAFAECVSFSSLSLLSKTVLIGECAFYRCVKLSGTLTLPSEVETLGPSCFAYTGITELVYFGTNEVKCSEPIFEEGKTVTLTFSDSYDKSLFCVTEKKPTFELVVSDGQVSASLDVNALTTEDELAKMLSYMFAQMSEQHETLDKVALIDSSFFSFKSELQNDQFIKPSKDSVIDFINGNLRVILPESGNVTVLVNKEEGSKLSVFGKGELVLKLGYSLRSQTVSLGTDSKIEDDVKITVYSDIEKVSFDTFNFEKEGSVTFYSEDDQPASNVEIKDVHIVANTKPSLSNAAISNSLKIEQTGVLNVENVVLDNCNVELEITDFNSKNHFITGTFKNPPKSLSIKKGGSDESSSVNEEEEYAIVKGFFDEGVCDLWLDKIDLKGSGFNTKKCTKSDNNLLLDLQNQQIVLKAVPSGNADISSSEPDSNSFEPGDVNPQPPESQIKPKPEPEPDVSSPHQPNNDDNKKDKKLSTGQIVGIVVGCVAGVAVIVAVVLLVVHFVKKKNDLNDQSIDNDCSF